MLIVGLVGGTEKRRDAVAAALSGSGRSRVAVYAMYSPESGKSRAGILEKVILDFDFGRDSGRGLVLSHVKTLEESELIRDRGGFLWHVEGVPSSEIPIQRGDVMVTDKSGGIRHYLDPFEALSETMVRSAKSPEAA